MINFKLSHFVTVIVFLISIPAVQAEDVLFESGSKQVALIELYSSEGCSSCPPADRWVASLKNNKQLWKEFVPLNFHVDYWNRLGWVDRFSHDQFTRRQRNYASEWGSGRVYTPGFVKNGEEWRKRNLSSLKGSGVGTLRVMKGDKGKVKIEYAPEKKDHSKYQVHLALLGNGLKTEVKHGENAGETLHHEFVVLKQIDQVLMAHGNLRTAEIKIPENKKAGAKSFSLAVWVSRPGSQKPVQATGGPLAAR